MNNDVTTVRLLHQINGIFSTQLVTSVRRNVPNPTIVLITLQLQPYKTFERNA